MYNDNNNTNHNNIHDVGSIEYQQNLQAQQNIANSNYAIANATLEAARIQARATMLASMTPEQQQEYLKQEAIVIKQQQEKALEQLKLVGGILLGLVLFGLGLVYPILFLLELIGGVIYVGYVYSKDDENKENEKGQNNDK